MGTAARPPLPTAALSPPRTATHPPPLPSCLSLPASPASPTPLFPTRLPSCGAAAHLVSLRLRLRLCLPPLRHLRLLPPPILLVHAPPPPPAAAAPPPPARAPSAGPAAAGLPPADAAPAAARRAPAGGGLRRRLRALPQQPRGERLRQLQRLRQRHGAPLGVRDLRVGAHHPHPQQLLQLRHAEGALRTRPGRR